VGTGKNAKKFTVTFVGQIACGCKPAKQPYPSKLGKNSGERILKLGLKRMISDIILKFMSFREVFFILLQNIS
jgi:hypothetical protein